MRNLTMASDAKARVLEEAWGGAAFTLSAENPQETLPGGSEEACARCAENGMAIASDGEACWTVERTPIPA